jgi:hypothetical protein
MVNNKPVKVVYLLRSVFMKTRKFCAFVSILAICVFGLFFIGCPADKSDENKTPSNNSTPGNNNTPGSGDNVSSVDLTPTAEDFDIGNLSQMVENITDVTITPKSNKSNGIPTIYYEGIYPTTYTKNTTLPTAIGVYIVTFDIASATGWKAATNLTAGTLIINGTFDNIETFRTFLYSLPKNTKDNPYIIKLNVVDIGSGLFYGLNNTYVSLDVSNCTFTGTVLDGEIYYYGGMSGVFTDCTGLTSVTIPNSIPFLSGTFNGCTDLTSITIPSSVTNIYPNTFKGCTSLTSIVIPNSVTRIARFTFESCTSLTSITIPNSVTTIQSSAFKDCTSLTSITIPNSVTSILDSAFQGCTNLTSVTFQGNISSSLGNFGTNVNGYYVSPFDGDLRNKFFASNSTYGTPGTYKTTAPVSSSSVWTRQ